ncbi:hypothetical protein ABZ914_00745 [Spirillospora sp. NPDC046719]
MTRPRIRVAAYVIRLRAVPELLVLDHEARQAVRWEEGKVQGSDVITQDERITPEVAW